MLSLPVVLSLMSVYAHMSLLVCLRMYAYVRVCACRVRIVRLWFLYFRVGFLGALCTPYSHYITDVVFLVSKLCQNRYSHSLSP